MLIIASLVLLSCNGKKSREEGKVIYDTIPVTNIKVMPEYYFAGDLTYKADTAVLKEKVTGQELSVARIEAYPEVEKKYTEVGLSGKPVYMELRGYLQQRSENQEGPLQKLVITQVVKIDSDAESPLRLLNGDYAAGNKKLSINPDHTYKLTLGDRLYRQGNWFLVAEDILVLNSDKDYEWMDIDWSNHRLSNRKDPSIIFSLIP